MRRILGSQPDTHKHTPRHMHFTKTQPTACMTHSNTRKQAFLQHTPKRTENMETNAFGAPVYAISTCVTAKTHHMHTQAHSQTNTHPHMHTNSPTKTRNCVGVTQRRSAGTAPYLQYKQILPHGKTQRAHVWQR